MKSPDSSPVDTLEYPPKKCCNCSNPPTVAIASIDQKGQGLTGFFCDGCFDLALANTIARKTKGVICIDRFVDGEWQIGRCIEG